MINYKKKFMIKKFFFSFILKISVKNIKKSAKKCCNS